MSWQQILSEQSQHWTYFFLGFTTATAGFLTFFLGLALGIIILKRYFHPGKKPLNGTPGVILEPSQRERL
jgi:hypothetical protein